MSHARGAQKLALTIVFALAASLLTMIWLAHGALGVQAQESRSQGQELRGTESGQGAGAKIGKTPDLREAVPDPQGRIEVPPPGLTEKGKADLERAR